MRIISGKFKGRKLSCADGKTTRPTMDFIKEAMFSIVYDFSGKQVLDLYAGSGSLGIEALSRGAASVDLVEFSTKAIAEIFKNLQAIGISNGIKVKKKKVDDFVKKCGKKYDVIFVDPPYQKNLINKTLRLILEHELLTEEGIIILEHHPYERIKIQDLEKYIIVSKKHSKCNITTVTGGNNENI